MDTRLGKMESGYCDGTLLACAGMIRSGLESKISEKLSPDTMLPAVSQGIIGLEINGSNTVVKEQVAAINDEETAVMAEAERVFLNTLEGGCQVPVGCYSVIEGHTFIFRGLVADPDGKKFVTGKNESPLKDAVGSAKKTADEILARGGKEIMAAINRDFPGNNEN